MKFLRHFFPLIFILLLSGITVIPFFHAGFFSFHDNTQVQRVYEMTKALGDGMFPVRWSEDLGFNYGYPMFNFYAPLAYYTGSFFNLLGADPLLATKIMIALGVILASFSMYLFTKEIFGKKTALVSAVFYGFAPFHAVDIYVRGDIAELWAFVFIPLIFYSIYKIYKSPNFLNVCFGALAYTGLVLSHNLTALMVSPFILLFIVLLSFLKKDKKSTLYLCLPIFLGILISAFYWIPAIFEMGYTNVVSQTTGGASFRDHFVCLNQLWSSSWGFGGSVKGCADGLSFMIGKLHLIFSLFSVALFASALFSQKISKEKALIFSFFIFGFLASVFFTLDYSKFIWEAVKPMAFFQYPWRFLLPASFFVSIIGGSFIYFLKQLLENIKNKWLISLTLLASLITVLFYVRFFVPQSYSLVSVNYFTNDYFLKWKTSTITNEYMPKNFAKPKSYNQLPKGVKVEEGKISIKSTTQETKVYSIAYDSNSSSKILFPLAYFPAWQLEIDGQKANFQAENNGLSVNAPSGTHTLVFNFIQTPLEKTSDIISICGILALFLGIIYKRLYEKGS